MSLRVSETINESAEDEFGHTICLNIGFIPRRVIRLKGINRLRWTSRLRNINLASDDSSLV